MCRHMLASTAPKQLCTDRLMQFCAVEPRPNFWLISKPRQFGQISLQKHFFSQQCKKICIIGETPHISKESTEENRLNQAGITSHVLWKRFATLSKLHFPQHKHRSAPSKMFQVSGHLCVTAWSKIFGAGWHCLHGIGPSHNWFPVLALSMGCANDHQTDHEGQEKVTSILFMDSTDDAHDDWSQSHLGSDFTFWVHVTLGTFARFLRNFCTETRHFLSCMAFGIT